VRALDLDERLVGVAFLDIGVYVTSLRTVKNLLLIGDAVKSVWFVAFQVRITPHVILRYSSQSQEDPYKLVVLAKDVRRICVTTAAFFFGDGEMSIVSGDEEGIIRLYEYDPSGEIYECRRCQAAVNRVRFQTLTRKMASICYVAPSSMGRVNASLP
jgi:cleavage and polyadenylation specificity factor subunit 1